MRARFVGNPDKGGEGPSAIKVFGLEFAKGEWVEIEDAAVFARLSGNNHFETGDAVLAPVEAFDHDGDGKPGGSKPGKPKGKAGLEPDPAPEPEVQE